MTIVPLASRLFAKLAKEGVASKGFQKVTTKITPALHLLHQFPIRRGMML